jgi:hypothetical protein
MRIAKLAIAALIVDSRGLSENRFNLNSCCAHACHWGLHEVGLVDLIIGRHSSASLL